MAFQALLPQFTEKNVAIVGCSNDGAAKNTAFAEVQMIQTELALALALSLRACELFIASCLRSGMQP